MSILSLICMKLHGRHTPSTSVRSNYNFCWCIEWVRISCHQLIQIIAFLFILLLLFVNFNTIHFFDRHKYLAEFLEVGGVLTLLEILGLKQAKEVCTCRDRGALYLAKRHTRFLFKQKNYQGISNKIIELPAKVYMISKE